MNTTFAMAARRVLTFAIVAVIHVSVAGEARADVSCHKINAKGVGQDNFDGTTTATIIGGGLLNGTTVGEFSADFSSPPIVPLAGTVTFTTRHGTLEVTVAGSVNVLTGEFNAVGPVTASSGKLAGATGMLTFTGVEDLVPGPNFGVFVEDVTGSICVDLSPES